MSESKVTPKQSEIEKRIEDESLVIGKYYAGHARDLYDQAFKAGAKFILEMPELEEFFTISTLLVSTYLSHLDYCDSLYDYEDEDEGACNCGLDTEEQCFNNALSKLHALGLV